MAGIHQSTDDFGGREHGLHFTNDAWNNTITNGDDFILRWNETIDAKLGTLGLFKVTYPSDGVVVYEVAQNITSLQPTYCKWRPESLGDGLYSFWLASDRVSNASFAISPPWTAKQPKVRSFTWAAPFLVPICLLLFLYFACVATCLLYRRRRTAKRQREAAARAARRRRAISASENDAEESYMMSRRRDNRQDSVDSNMTLEPLEPPEDVLTKQGVWLPTTTTSSNAGSEDTVVSESSQMAERRAAHKKALAESAVRFVRTGP
ncbi:Tyrosine--tRNA cytoplasmic [Cordyceps militaris]|uniref:Tyrosine--tRNA cytoplasmic n=1 Tax=Cordyceps militaris TaxID=73501 RepID=A0A2H4SN17_CORMI|nr:Tyrosine--tRNA cytoplasmic [Cordyceps militaris]